MFPDASGALTNRLMTRGSMAESPTAPARAIGNTRAASRVAGTFKDTKTDRAKVTKNANGIMAMAPREYVRTIQAEAHTKASVLSFEPRKPTAR